MVIFEARTVVFIEESKPAFGSLLSTRKSRDLQGIKQYRGINEKQENLTHYRKLLHEHHQQMFALHAGRFSF